MPGRRFPRFLVLLLVLPALTTLHSLGFRYTISGSVPRGLYLATPRPLARGTYVAFCLPLRTAQLGLQRGYIPGGSCPFSRAQPLLKQIAALPGDLVEVTPSAIRLNGRLIPNSAQRPFDRHGQPLLALEPGLYQVPADYVWLGATADFRSWDSRYYGALPLLSIRETLTPVLTW